ncbi:PstS family phosphate ABC transporter substrate-binding protein [Frankia sp. QA3]|uniref:PstS family phosphate ABC transporter substrate-binding protein n=1 Tax=Frankia sp. QA3 TaxID=710111 RepID=UPI000269BF6C|nr:substrate-binding domain-containing protein [Frankia sp. QA3]EIV92441.1 ABC-type phosphate transport system, periplasmic component [Frankia sp. QA3]
MDWLNAGNVIAVLTALLGLVASFAAVWYERRVPRRRRIGYRVQMDIPIGNDNRGGPGQENIRSGLFNDLPDMADATLALLRIENYGAESIAESDYTGRNVHGLTAVFTDRTVRGMAVTTSHDDEHLMDHFTPAGGMRHEDNTIYLPRVPLNHGQHYKLLVLLTGGRVGRDIRVVGGIREGIVRPNRGIPVDDKPPLFSRPARWITILLTLCVIGLAGIILISEDAPPPIGCATGKLTVNGSTGFSEVMKAVAKRYQSDCPNSTITVDAQGSNEGFQQLKDAGGNSALITIVDGSRTENLAQEMREERVAVSAFALVVNDDVPVRSLTVDQIRKIFRGDILNWNQVGGLVDRPILVVSRFDSSGTRRLFDQRVLGVKNEREVTVAGCEPDVAQAGLRRCERRDTKQVLSTVAKQPGAIGYSELQTATAVQGLHILEIDGRAPSLEAHGSNAYPFTGIEYAYTYGKPSSDSLTSSFLYYLTRGRGQDVMEDSGHPPCYKPENLERCQQ